MTVDDRLEIRITGEEKATLARRAQAEGVTVSTLIRRGIHSVLQRPGPLETHHARAIVRLRRRVNDLATRLEATGGNGGEVAAMRRDLAQAHADARLLLGRG